MHKRTNFLSVLGLTCAVHCKLAIVKVRNGEILHERQHAKSLEFLSFWYQLTALGMEILPSNVMVSCAKYPRAKPSPYRILKGMFVTLKLVDAVGCIVCGGKPQYRPHPSSGTHVAEDPAITLRQ